MNSKQIEKTVSEGATSVSARLNSKSVIAAVLKTGSSISPAVQMNDGSIYVGEPFHLSATKATFDVVETPSLEEMLASSEEYCGHLEQVMTKAYGPGVQVKAQR